jgi:hypothetical protein
VTSKLSRSTRLIAATALVVAAVVGATDSTVVAAHASAKPHRHAGRVQTPPPLTLSHADAAVLAAVRDEFPPLDPAVSPSLTRSADCQRTATTTFSCRWSVEIPAQCASYAGSAAVAYRHSRNRHSAWTAAVVIQRASTCEQII